MSNFDIVIQIITTLLIFIGLLLTFYELRKNNKLRKLEYYTNLELASVDIFRLEIDHPQLRLIYANDKVDNLTEDQVFQLEEYAASILNMFEVQFKLRNSKDIESEIFASWLPWLFELCNGYMFKKIWGELKYSYVSQFRIFVDELIKICENENMAQRENIFYRKAAEMIDCHVILNWRN